MKICQYHSNKNCFLYLKSDPTTLNISENDALEIVYNKDQVGFFTAQIITSSSNRSNDDCVMFNGVQANKLKIKEKDQISIRNVHRNPIVSQSITLRPLSNDDWQILELNLDAIENNLLDQIKVVYKNQIFPIWVESDCYIFVQTIDFEPSSNLFVTINGMTRVIVEPYVQASSSLLANQMTNSLAGSSSIAKEWMATFHVECLGADEQLAETSRCHANTKCSNLTKVELTDTSTTDFDQMEKFLVSIVALDPPMRALPLKESTTGSMKKFINSISSSYPSGYLEERASSGDATSVWAILNCCPRDFSKGTKPRLKISNFLQQQLRLFQVNPKVLVKAIPVTAQLEQSCLSSSVKKSLKLRTNYSKNPQHVREGFVKFIDENCDCLCPILLGSGMKLVLKVGDTQEEITCQVILPSATTTTTTVTPIAVSSSVFLNDLIDIQIEIQDLNNNIQISPLDNRQENDRLRANRFDLTLYKSKWFDKNMSEIQTFLNKNLFTRDESFFPRGLVLYGLRGSGKTTMCKHLCNEASTKLGAIFHLIDCQNFMSKTADTIHDQLKFVYQDCVWYENRPCLVFLENIDLLIENKSHSIDPSSMLYHCQIIEAIKDVLSFVWSHESSRVVTIVTTSTPFIELPSVFHCLDEHGFFTQFMSISSHTIKEETRELIDEILKQRSFNFEPKLVEFIADHSDGYVLKDLEKLVEQLAFNHWSLSSSSSDELSVVVAFDDSSSQVLQSYVCINMLETKFYKTNHELNWSQIGGLESVKQTLTETLIWPIKYKEIYERLCMKHSGGCLLYGPSGCGKTLLASALANESKFNFMSVKGPELLSKFIGASEQNVRELFNRAQKARPCIIFFDEFDSLAPKRGHDSTGVTDRVVNQLLTLLDGIEQLDGVYILAATSRPDLIDQALLRPGRLDSYLFIDYPNKEELRKIMGLYLEKLKFDREKISIDELSDMCEGLSGADVKSIVGDALVKAFHRATKGDHSFLLESRRDLSTQTSDNDLMEKICVEKDDLLVSIDSIKQTINLNERHKLKLMYENWMRQGNSLATRREDHVEKKPRITLA